MKSIHPSNRGQVLIIFVFVIIALIGFTGLAVDGGNVYADRRRAQNAADTAALAASLARISWSKANAGATCTPFDTEAHVQPSCSTDPVTAAINRAGDNGYQNNGGSTQVFVYSPPKDGPYASCTSPCDPNDYIEVVIQNANPTYFAKVLGIGTLNNRVQAVALAKYTPTSEYYGGMTLVQLDTGNGNCPSDFNVGGGGTVTLNGGGIWVNSTNMNCAYKQTSCNTQVISGDPNNPATIQVVGGVATNTCTATANTAPVVTGAGPHYDYTPAHIFPAPPSKPPYCAAHAGTYLNGNFQPGDYQGMGAFPIGNINATLQPGVYCVDRLVTTKNITGNGVFIYIYPTTNHSQVDMSGGVINLSAIDPVTNPNNPYAGFLIYGDYDNNSWTNNPPTCTIAGGTNSVYTGMIWVPLCNLTISGNTSSDGENAQIIAASISLSGTMNLTFTYDASKYPKIPEENKTGLFR